jgi:hypothetical protein
MMARYQTGHFSMSTAEGGTRTLTSLRTPDFESVNPTPESANPSDVTDKPPLRLARPLAQELQNRPSDPALARIVEAWPKLPEAIRKAMLALAESGD